MSFFGEDVQLVTLAEGDPITASSIQLADSYKNYQAIIFILRLPDDNAVVSHLWMTYELSLCIDLMANRQDGRVVIATSDAHYWTLDATKSTDTTFVKHYNYGNLQKIIGIKLKGD